MFIRFPDLICGIVTDIAEIWKKDNKYNEYPQRYPEHWYNLAGYPKNYVNACMCLQKLFAPNPLNSIPEEHEPL